MAINDDGADRRWTALGELASEGMACVMCGQALLNEEIPTPHVEVGVNPETGTPVYACKQRCADLANFSP